MRAQAITSRLIESLYAEALLLADETRGYFDETGDADRAGFTPAQRVLFACEALKASTRLMQVISWLLMRKAVIAGEVSAALVAGAEGRLEEGPAIDLTALDGFPERARQLVLSGVDLHQRVARIETGEGGDAPVSSPARALLDRLERSI